MDIDAAIKRPQFTAKYVLRQFLPVHHLADFLYQGMEQGKFHRRHGYFDSIFQYGSCPQIENDIIHYQSSGKGASGIESALSST